jgi:hypothetical protein
LLFAFLLCSCRHFDATDFKNGDTVHIVTHSLSHTMWAHMPDGEVLEGKFATVDGGSVGFSFGSATAYGGGQTATAFGSGTSYSVGGRGEAYALLKSTKPGSHLMMELIATYNPMSAHGWGEARTNDGRSYKVIF